MITTYSSRDYRITYQGIALIENALERPDLVQVSVVSGCTILVAPQKEYGIDYEPNGEYRYWYMEGMNTQLARAEAHFIYARLNRDDKNALLLFSVNDYDTDGKINGEGTASEDYYYIKIGSITKTDSVTNPTLDREITIDFGYLTTPAGSDADDDGWRKLFEVTADDLIRPLKKFTSYIVQGTLSIIGKIVLNEKEITDVAREGDQGGFIESDEYIPTTKFLKGKYLNELRNHLLSKDMEDQTEFLLKLLGGTITPRVQSPSFAPGPLGTGYTVQMNENGQSYIEVDKLLVRMQAIFQRLSIAETDIAGYTLALNAGPRITCTGVEIYEPSELFFVDGSEAYFSDGNRVYVDGYIRCYFLNDDGEKTVENSFKIGDLVRSQTFNIKPGVHENVSNHYYWRKVVGVGDNYIDLGIQDCDPGSDLPKEGDAIVQFGNETDPDRQNLIVFSAYGEGAPYITFYKGINSYSLNGKEQFVVGYDSVTQECYLKNFGRAFLGLRDESSYLRVEPLMNKMFFKGDVEITGGFNDEIAKYIGYSGGWSELISEAIKGRTFIKGGYINAELLDVKTVITSNLIANAIKANELNVNDKFIVSEDGKLTAEGADIKGVITAYSGEFNNGTFNDCSAVNLIATNITAQGTFKTSNGNEQIIIDSDSNAILFKSGNVNVAQMFFFDYAGYKTARIELKTNGGSYLNTSPGEISLRDFRPESPIGTSSEIQLKCGYSGLMISNITTDEHFAVSESGMRFDSGGTRYEGQTGSMEVVSNIVFDFNGNVSYINKKKIYFKGGIIYGTE